MVSLCMQTGFRFIILAHYHHVVVTGNSMTTFYQYMTSVTGLFIINLSVDKMKLTVDSTRARCSCAVHKLGL
jgi:hypothetical protein